MSGLKQIVTVLLILAGGVFMTMTESDAKSRKPELKQSPFASEVSTALKLYDDKRPEDRVYLMFDKPFYRPGETVWFQAYVRQGTDMKASEISEIVHVEWIAPSGNIEKELSLIARNGTASGDISLDDSASGGIYTVKAYTQWQKNSTNPAFFEKKVQVQKVVLPTLKMKLEYLREAYGKGDEVSAEITVETLDNQPLSESDIHYRVTLKGNRFLDEKSRTGKDGSALIRFRLPEDLDTADGLLNVMIPYQGKTESISRSVPILLSNLSVELFPEGGDLVAGFPSRVGIRVLDEFGKPADIKGVVETDSGKALVHFETFHKGLGVFTLPPVKEPTYVRVLKPVGVTKRYPLPEPMKRGYTLEASLNKTNSIRVIVRSTEKEMLSIVAKSRGESVKAFSFDAIKGENSMDLDTDAFPAGVVQLTLFDSKGIERAERLVFVNRENLLSVTVSTDKEKYLPREKVRMEITVADERGMPVPAQLSLSVVDDKLLSFADDKSGNILSKLLLEPDLKDEVYEPAFYFDPKEERRFQAMDCLMLTHGWRRFTWKEVLDIKKYAPQFAAEKAEIRGVVLSGYHKPEPVSGVEVKVESTGRRVVTDKNGEFVIRDLDLYEVEILTASKGKKKSGSYRVSDYSTHVTLYLEEHYPVKRRGWFGGVEKEMAMPMAGAPPEAEMMMDEMVMEAGEPPEPGVMDDAMVGAEPDEIPEPEIVADKAEVLEEEVLDLRFEKRKVAVAPVPPPEAPVYYRAREFPAPVYKTLKTEERTDFRSTVFWKGNIETDRKGIAVIEFYNSDEITAFRSVVEGVGTGGLVGRNESLHYTQLPFSMDVKLPVEVSMGDRVMVPLSIVNNTDEKITGFLKVTPPESFRVIEKTAAEVTVKKRSATVLSLPYEVLNKPGTGTFRVECRVGNDSDRFSREVVVVPKGFPVSIGVSEQERDKTVRLKITRPVSGSISAKFSAYPTVLSDMLKGIESILREPYGCFEQTSSSTYPNIMVLDYMRENKESDPEVMKRASSLIEQGYKRLISFETEEKGYEWFGENPGHEALTAYGLMEFTDMKAVYPDVDDEMVKRTGEWLLAKRDGKGSFKRNEKALDSFGRADDAITNAYIVYALSEAGFVVEIKKELDLACKNAEASNDPYQLALVTNALFNVKDRRAETFLKQVLKAQAQDGSWTGTKHSVTCSTGKALAVETTALAVLAAMKPEKKDSRAIDGGIRFIVKSRSSYGGFGNTQSTVLALKALTEFTKYSRRTAESGTVEIHVNGKKVAQTSYKAGEKGEITIPEETLTPSFDEGEYSVRIRYIDVKNPLPYTFSINYNTFQPATSEKCDVSLETSLAENTVRVGETVRLTTRITSKKQEDGLPMTIAVVGIPGGLSPQPWQLKELQEKKVVDYYEVRGNTVVYYYRQMKPGESREVHLDLKAEIPGTYTGSASSSYLYYTNEFKSWVSGEAVVITD